ncbi:hypothetical protein [Bacillus halotolerans]|uniref:hypothetical protein n=1 Tax=Bacillus halotolerans TaxID=260554 RepID=UPI001D0CEB9A|nr:hypothetical protein [Bacillus halotolerans]MEC1543417.1 hypothetical protein [Bacillus halotolerans]
MELKDKIKRVAIYLRKSRNNEGEETEETLAKHRKRLLDIAEKKQLRELIISRSRKFNG